tara:strand:- start:877 stop:1080 length:204 start_codon:yes stop_codon:yes gene_type:complete
VVLRIGFVLNGSEHHQGWDAHEDLSLARFYLLFEFFEALAKAFDVQAKVDYLVPVLDIEELVFTQRP